MLFNLLLTSLLLAATAAAMPSRRQSQPGLSIDLKNTMLAVVEQLQASMDGTAVPVSSNATYDEATISCIEVCIPEYHCTLYDQDLAPFASLNPGTSTFDSSQVSQIECAQGLV